MRGHGESVLGPVVLHVTATTTTAPKHEPSEHRMGWAHQRARVPSKLPLSILQPRCRPPLVLSRGVAEWKLREMEREMEQETAGRRSLVYLSLVAHRFSRLWSGLLLLPSVFDPGWRGWNSVHTFGT